MQMSDVGQERAEGSQPVERPCPECGSIVPVHYGYVTWCDGCGWNLKPEVISESRTLFGEIYRKLSRRLSKDLFNRMLREEALAPRFTFSGALAFLIAAAVHAVTAVFLLAGGAFVLLGWPNILLVALGLLCLCIAIAARPRIVKAPDEGLLPRDSFPALYKLADDVADAMGAKRMDHIVVSIDFNASFVRAGWRRKRYLEIGLPLFAIQSNAERVALLGHEIGHSANGDNGRRFFVVSAMETLEVWYGLIRPHTLLSSESGMPGFVMLPVNLLLYGVAGMIRGWIWALVHLLFRNSQRAEYLADSLAAVVAGDQAAVGLGEMLYRGGLYDYVVQRVANSNGQLRLFDELGHQMSIIPERELERIRRVSLLPESRIDTTHPPTAYRISFLEQRSKGEPKVVIAPEDSRLLEQELASLHDVVERSVLDRYRDSLYYR